MERGIVKFFNAEKGFGFISKDGQVDTFVHHSILKQSGIEKLEEGQSVLFAAVPGKDGKGPKAISVSIGLP